MQKLKLVEVKLGDKESERYFKVTDKGTFRVVGKRGSAVLTLNPGVWHVYEKKKELNKWQKFLKMIWLYDDQYFIRAERIR